MDDLFQKFKNLIKEEDIRFYPNINSLNDPIAKFYGYDNFLIGSGSDRCIKYFFEGNDKKKLLITDPTFPMYNVYGNMFNMSIQTISYNGTSFPSKKYISAIDENSMVVISNPSSPIGDVIPKKTLIEILKKGQPTLIDEAYIEFSNEESMITEIDNYSNLYVTRTFSKALGSAGVRFGVLFSNKNNLESIQQYRDMYEITGLTLRWIELVLNNPTDYLNYVTEVKRNKVSLIKRLQDLKYNVISSECNWIHVKGLKNLPKNIIFKTNCTLPGLGDDWVRLQITDNINDYKWILK